MAEPGRKIDPAIAEITRVDDALTRSAKKQCAKIGWSPDTVIPGTGKSAKDLAADTIVKLHVHGWVPGAGGEDILPLGREILKNLFRDLLRSSGYRQNLSLDSEDFEKLDEARTELMIQPLIELLSVIEKITARLTDEMEKRYLEALSEGARTR